MTKYEKLTCDEIKDVDNHSANDFNEQSQLSGFSFNDNTSIDCAKSNAFFATIDMSFPSSRSSFSEGSGAVRSDVNALEDKRKLLKYFFNSL